MFAGQPDGQACPVSGWSIGFGCGYVNDFCVGNSDNAVSTFVQQADVLGAPFELQTSEPACSAIYGLEQLPILHGSPAAYSCLPKGEAGLLSFILAA